MKSKSLPQRDKYLNHNFSIKINSTVAQKDQYFIPLTLKNIILMKNMQHPFYLMIYGKSWHVPLGS